MAAGSTRTVEEFFAGHEASRKIFDAVVAQIERIEPVSFRISKSQIGLIRNGHPFAWCWMPGSYLRGNVAPLVLSLAMRHRVDSPRWKEIVEASPGRFTHHLELHTPQDVDAQVLRWLREAWKCVESLAEQDEP